MFVSMCVKKNNYTHNTSYTSLGFKLFFSFFCICFGFLILQLFFCPGTLNHGAYKNNSL
jgi:hypothetical protein